MRQLRVMTDGAHNPLASMINQSDYIDEAILGVATKEDFTVPAGANKVILSATGDFYCQIGPSADAAINAADIVDGSGSELNPIAREVVPGDTISLISAAVCRISMAFYR